MGETEGQFYASSIAGQTLRQIGDGLGLLTGFYVGLFHAAYPLP